MSDLLDCFAENVSDPVSELKFDQERDARIIIYMKPITCMLNWIDLLCRLQQSNISGFNACLYPHKSRIFFEKSHADLARRVKYILEAPQIWAVLGRTKQI